MNPYIVTISTNPYQGLKLKCCYKPDRYYYVTISTNPYQGFKLGWWILLVTNLFSYNFHESLSGIETRLLTFPWFFLFVTISTNPYQGLKPLTCPVQDSAPPRTLQFPRIPIRDWNKKPLWKKLFYKALQFPRIPIRDWNGSSNDQDLVFWELEFLRIPIRDWNA